MPYPSRLLRGIAPVVCGALLSCGGGDDARLFDCTGTAGATGASDAGLMITLGNTDASLGLSVDGAPSGLVGSGSLDDAACAHETRKGEQIPLDMYIMLDRSPSMTDLISDMKTTKWDAVRNAITAFLNDPASKGLGVGLQFFPLNQPNTPAACTTMTECGQFGPCVPLVLTCDNTTSVTPCTPQTVTKDCPRGGRCVELGKCGTGICPFVGQYCAPETPRGQPQLCTPMRTCLERDVCIQASYVAPSVEVAALPGAAAAIIASLPTHTPDAPDPLPISGTPTVMALNGALTHAAALSKANPNHRLVVVLATDGLPTAECEPDIPALDLLTDPARAATLIQRVATLASTAVKGKPSISTFVIGVFAPAEATTAQPNLDAIAMAGGTNKSFVVTTSQNVTMAFLDALNAIRTTALTCEYNVPQPEAGQLDYNAVNVTFTSGAGKQLTVPYSGGTAASCTDKGGWYYDADPTTGGTPTKIEVCPVSCNALKADTAGQVNILLGCKTESIVR